MEDLDETGGSGRLRTECGSLGRGWVGSWGSQRKPGSRRPEIGTLGSVGHRRIGFE